MTNERHRTDDIIESETMVMMMIMMKGTTEIMNLQLMTTITSPQSHKVAPDHHACAQTSSSSGGRSPPSLMPLFMATNLQWFECIWCECLSVLLESFGQ